MGFLLGILHKDCCKLEVYNESFVEIETGTSRSGCSLQRILLSPSFVLCVVCRAEVALGQPNCGN